MYWRIVVGPVTIGRTRSGEALAVRARINSLSKSSATVCAQVAQAFVIALAPVVAVLASQQFRHWLVELTANLLVLGGFIAAPILTVVAWVGLMLPSRLALHQMSSTLFIVALIWVAAGLLIAHLLHDSSAQGE